MLRAISALDTTFQRVLGLACVVLFATMILAVGGQVVMRYVFNSPLHWSEELARYAMVWLAMLASALAARLGQHIALADLIPLPRRVKVIVNGAAIVLVVVVLAVLVYHSWDLTIRSQRQTTPGLGLPMSLPYASIPVGAVLMIVGLVLGWIRAVLSPETTRQLGAPVTTAPKLDTLED